MSEQNGLIPIEFTCAMCAQLLQKPVTYAECEHRMCCSCFANAILEDPPVGMCPQCSEPFLHGARAIPDDELARRIKEATKSSGTKRKSTDSQEKSSSSSKEKKHRKSVEPVAEIDENARLREEIEKLKRAVQIGRDELQQERLKHEALRKAMDSETSKSSKLLDKKPVCMLLWNGHQAMELAKSRHVKHPEDKAIEKAYEAAKFVYSTAVEKFADYAKAADEFFVEKRKSLEKKRESAKKKKTSQADETTASANAEIDNAELDNNNDSE